MNEIDWELVLLSGIVSAMLMNVLWRWLWKAARAKPLRRYVVHRTNAAEVAVTADDCVWDEVGIEFVGTEKETIAFFPMGQVMYVETDTAAGH